MTSDCLYPVLKSSTRYRQSLPIKEQKMKKGRIALTLVLSILLCAIIGGVMYLYFNGYSGFDNHSKATHGEIKVACVGDSITYGHGITNWPKNNYPRLLGDMLGDGYAVNNYGHHGATLQSTGDQPYISYSDYDDSIEFGADVLILMLGSNDAKLENWTDEATFRAEYLRLLESYRASNPDIRIILCTPPKSYRKNSENPIRADIIAGVVREIANEEGLQLVDVNALTDGRRDLYLSDGAHLSNEGARILAEAIYNAIISE